MLLDVRELGLDERHISSLELARFECRRWSMVSLIVAIEDLFDIFTIIIAIHICTTLFVLHSLLLQIVGSGLGSGLGSVDEPEQIRMTLFEVRVIILTGASVLPLTGLHRVIR